MVSGYEINMCFYAVSIVEGFREWILPKEDKFRSGASEYVGDYSGIETTNGLQVFFQSQLIENSERRVREIC